MAKKFALTAVIAAAVLVAAPVTVRAQVAGIKLGVLTCNVAAGPGYVLGSSRPIDCVFGPTGGPPEHYVGTISKLGVDIGYQGWAQLNWWVFAPTSDVGPGSLQGTYVGAGASATVGIGAGANVLIGGFQESFNLQPVSVQGSVGLDVTAGVGGLTLQYSPP
jgi:hypothetical protein